VQTSHSCRQKLIFLSSGNVEIFWKNKRKRYFKRAVYLNTGNLSLPLFHFIRLLFIENRVGKRLFMKTQLKSKYFVSETRAYQQVQMAEPKEKINIPFLRPELNEDEINEVVSTLRSGWLTTGPKTKLFESDFAEAVKSSYAVALNSCTAALHLAVEALGLQAGQAVLVPTMTFAATAEIILYKNAVPVLVDCDPETGNMDLQDARRKIEDIRAGRLPFEIDKDVEIVGIIPVHVGGFMLDIDELKGFAKEFGLWIVEDAAHALPSAWRKSSESPWQYCGENTADVTCYSFYANKTITTGEGGMAVTNDSSLEEKIRLMSLHGLSRDAWKRYTDNGTWDYRIVAPGYKYNLTDIAAAIGIHQLARAETMRQQREEVAQIYLDMFSNIDELELPPIDENRLHSWHLFPLRLKTEKLSIDRNDFFDELKKRGVNCSVHWRPLHLHPLYQTEFNWRAEHLPTASHLWKRLISLPIFPAMTNTEINYVVNTVTDVCFNYSKKKVSMLA
jgi:dTDP-4-amino-4,6-dideoxygalactose transaminase